MLGEIVGPKMFGEGFPEHGGVKGYAWGWQPAPGASHRPRTMSGPISKIHCCEDTVVGTPRLIVQPPKLRMGRVPIP